MNATLAETWKMKRRLVLFSIMLWLGSVALASGCDSGGDDADDGPRPSISMAELHGACALLDTCLGEDGQGVAYEYCVTAYLWISRSQGDRATQLDPTMDCLLSASTCLAAVQCLQGGCSNTRSCEGSVLTDCIDYFPVQVDCADFGGHCPTTLDGYAHCPIGTPSGSCDTQEEGMKWCQGTVRSFCEGGVLYSDDCASQLSGGLCVEASSYPICTLDPQSTCLEGYFNESCDGAMTVKCNSGRVEYKDCRKSLREDATCEVHESSAWCALPGSSCAGVVGEGQCECRGDELWCCIAGTAQTFDCSAWSATCVTDGWSYRGAFCSQ